MLYTLSPNLYEMSDPVLWEKNKQKNVINLSFAELAQIIVKINALHEGKNALDVC